MKLSIPRRGTWDVESFQEASEVYCKLRDLSGEGYSTFRAGILVSDDRTKKWRVSYNGRIWAGTRHQPGVPAVYDPCDKEEAAS